KGEPGAPQTRRGRPLPRVRPQPRDARDDPQRHGAVAWACRVRETQTQIWHRGERPYPEGAVQGNHPQGRLRAGEVQKTDRGARPVWGRVAETRTAQARRRVSVRG